MPDFLSFPFAKYNIDVSRETREKFNRYAEILFKWQKTINLIGDSTLEDLAERHFLDSAQLINFLPDRSATLADMGSGAGFPGMVLAILGMKKVHLIESDMRKATFLREVSRETGTPVTVHDDRVEETVIEGLDIVTARALAPLKDLLKLSQRLSPGSQPTCLFMKGENAEEEIARAKKQWNFDLKSHQSVTDKSGKILEINNLTTK